ncbi:MAG: class A beta-lactamase, subclass A2 [Bacteroidota bacterium]|jgi:beta-lactamase class A
MTKIQSPLTLLFLLSCSFASAQTDSLHHKIETVLSGKKAVVGVSIYGIENKEWININNDRHYPMQSVFKFHIALTVLHRVDEGKLQLSLEIMIKKNDLLPNTWSPIRDKYPDGNVVLSLAEIINYTVALSDNNGCDILLRLIGGVKVVNEYIHSLGITDVAVAANEEEMHKAWDVQYANWTTPKAATDLLVLFYDQKVLSKTSFSFLWNVMIETSTGTGRIKAGVPEGTPVAHKTGTSDRNNEGIAAAANNIGIVSLPNGTHFAISVFVSNSKETDETNDTIIAAVARAAWDHFTLKTD